MYFKQLDQKCSTMSSYCLHCRLLHSGLVQLNWLGTNCQQQLCFERCFHYSNLQTSWSGHSGCRWSSCSSGCHSNSQKRKFGLSLMSSFQVLFNSLRLQNSKFNQIIQLCLKDLLCYLSNQNPQKNQQQWWCYQKVKQQSSMAAMQRYHQSSCSPDYQCCSKSDSTFMMLSYLLKQCCCQFDSEYYCCCLLCHQTNLSSKVARFNSQSFNLMFNFATAVSNQTVVSSSKLSQRCCY